MRIPFDAGIWKRLLSHLDLQNPKLCVNRVYIRDELKVEGNFVFNSLNTFSFWYFILVVMV